MSLNVSIVIATLLGNGSILLLLQRFKSLRTVPNILIANLALIDIFNVVVTLPLWMSTRRVIFAVLGMWIVTIALTIPWFLNLYQINLGDAPTVIYRMIYYHMVGEYVTIIRSAFAVVYLLLALMTWKSLRDQTKKYDGDLSLPDRQRVKLQASRRRTESHAAITVGLTVVAYILSCIPLIVYGILTKKARNLVGSEFFRWFALFANYSQYVSSLCNPFIYMARCNRFNHALKELWRYLCRSSKKTCDPAKPAKIPFRNTTPSYLLSSTRQQAGIVNEGCTTDTDLIQESLTFKAHNSNEQVRIDDATRKKPNRQARIDVPTEKPNEQACMDDATKQAPIDDATKKKPNEQARMEMPPNKHP
ncbi:predicted protein [Nematostella vectensis]|uniref:G-protein coupled receptors family 1 profile domain-containing protein n=1 Tax=Nematostella vectensis TaxID=45351 RepID=A7SFW5_NEMVE|nr:predicted protein [Nematostella vectensis]|eukprot:XP_001629484.1 predicted protein [Nematostella vectensis]